MCSLTEVPRAHAGQRHPLARHADVNVQVCSRRCHDSPMTRVDSAPGEHGGPVVSAIDHIGIAVPDLGQAVDFYERVFGLTVSHQERNDEQGVIEAMVGVGDAAIQLLAPTGPDSPIARFLERSGPGIQQVAYRVDDVAAASAILRLRGVRMLYDEPRIGTAGCLINFAHPKDCGGVLVELVQVPGSSDASAG